MQPSCVTRSETIQRCHEKAPGQEAAVPAGLFGRLLSVTVSAPAPGAALPTPGDMAAPGVDGSERDECAAGRVSPGSRSDKTAKASENECSPEAVSPDDADRGPSAGPQPVRHELQDDDPADAVALPLSDRLPDAAAELKPFIVQQFLHAQMRLKVGMAGLSTVGSVMAGGVMRTQPVLPGGNPALMSSEKAIATDGGAEDGDTPVAAAAGQRSVSAARADAAIRHSPSLSGQAALAPGLQPAAPDKPLQSAQQQRELPNMPFAPRFLSSRDPVGAARGSGDGLRAAPVEAAFGGDHQSVRRIDNGAGMAGSEHRAAEVDEARSTQGIVLPGLRTPRPEASTDLQHPEPERQILRAEPAAPLEKAGPADDPPSEARQPPLRRGAQNVTAKGASLHTAAPFLAPPQSASDVALGNAGSALAKLEPASDVAMQPLRAPDDVNRMPESPPFAVFASPAHATAPAGASMIPVIGQIADQLASRLGALTDGAAAEPVRSGLMLAPPELGRVVIRYDPELLGAVLVLQVERPETLDLMRRHQELLQAALQVLGQSGCELRLEAQGRGHDGPSHHASALRVQDPQAENSAARAASEPPVDSLRRREDGRLDLRL